MFCNSDGTDSPVRVISNGMDTLMNIRIEPLKPEHYDAVMDIHSTILKRVTKPQWKSPVFSRLSQENTIGFVALLEDKVIGFIISALRQGDFGVDRCGWIEVVGVDPRYMGHGIGRDLARHLLDHYRSIGVEDVYSSVRWDAADMLSFFKSLGFDRSNFLNLRKKLD